jgi:hypothetical protein
VRHRFADRLPVQRAQRAQVDHLRLNAVVGQGVGGLQRSLDHREGGDDGDVRARATYGGSAELRRLALAVELALARVERLVLKDHDGVRVLNRRASQGIRVGRRRRRDQLEARLAHEPAGGRLRVAGPEARAGAHGAADGQRHRALLVGEVPILRCLVAERVEDKAEEVAEHDLDDRAQPAHGRAEGRRGEGELGDRRVDDPLGAEAVDEVRSDVEDPALGHVLAEQHHARVGFHLIA